MRFVVGSAAIKHYYPQFREPNDVDVWITGDETMSRGSWAGMVEFSVMPDNIMELLLKGRPKYMVSGIDYRSDVPSLTHLYTIKMSHIFWNIGWEKHIKDIYFFQKVLGYRKVDEALYALLVEYWKEKHGAKKVSLAQSKDEFFTDNVNYVYDHDYLHELVAYNKEPMYKCVLKEGAEVLIDKEKFLALPRKKQLQMIREECYVIALERYLIPNNFSIGKREAYAKAMKLMITSLSKGWFARFVVDNYVDLWRVDEHNFVKLFLTRETKNDRYFSKNY